MRSILSGKPASLHTIYSTLPPPSIPPTSNLPPLPLQPFPLHLSISLSICLSALVPPPTPYCPSCECVTRPTLSLYALLQPACLSSGRLLQYVLEDCPLTTATHCALTTKPGGDRVR